MSYKDMAFAAERTGAIALNGKPFATFHKEISDCLLWPIDQYEQEDEWKGIESGEFARAWTCEELVGMLKSDISQPWHFIWWTYNFPANPPSPWRVEKVLSDIIYVRDGSPVHPIILRFFDSLVEALLFAVMFERGYQWDGKEFKKEEGK